MKDFISFRKEFFRQSYFEIFASARKSFGVMVCSFCGAMDKILTRISADFFNGMKKSEGQVKISPEQNIP